MLSKQPIGDMWSLPDNDPHSQHYGESLDFDFSCFHSEEMKSVVKDYIWHCWRVNNGALSSRQWLNRSMQYFMVFAKANNIGLKWAGSVGIPHYLLLNNDTEIAPDAIENMWKCHEEHNCIVTPKIYYADQRDLLWSAGGRFTPVIKKPVQTGLNEKDSDKYNQDVDCGFANGCALFLDEKILKQTGFLDESFFLYYEDTEFSARARKQGVKIRYCAEAKVYHKVNGSTKGNYSWANVYYITRNWLIYSKMHLGGKMWLFWLYFLPNRLVWILIWLMQRKPEMLKAVWQGIRDYFIWLHKPDTYSDKLQ